MFVSLVGWVFRLSLLRLSQYLFYDFSPFFAKWWHVSMTIWLLQVFFMCLIFLPIMLSPQTALHQKKLKPSITYIRNNYTNRIHAHSNLIFTTLYSSSSSSLPWACPCAQITYVLYSCIFLLVDYQMIYNYVVQAENNHKCHVSIIYFYL